jgi:hypothetical protein
MASHRSHPYRGTIGWSVDLVTPTPNPKLIGIEPDFVLIELLLSLLRLWETLEAEGMREGLPREQICT